jgi:hypothetical protein
MAREKKAEVQATEATAPTDFDLVVNAINDPVQRFVAVMKERHAIYMRRQQGLLRPWTDDPILQQFRFCNIYRELDRVTIWITEHWREPHRDDPDLWFAMSVARFVNWPDTLAELGYPVPWEADRFLAVAHARKERGEVCFGPAYNISNNGSKAPKAEHLDHVVFAPLWSPLRRKSLRPRDDDSLLSFYGRLKKMNGLGSFMAAQVVADIKYVAPLRHARDWMTFAAPGPGSKRGLNRILGRPVDAHWTDEAWHFQLLKFREVIGPLFTEAGLELSHAQDTQNQLCEFDKYERRREGKPLKRRYRS